MYVCMVKMHTTITLDYEVWQKGVDILKDEGKTLSFFVESKLKKLINNHQKEVKK